MHPQSPASRLVLYADASNAVVASPPPPEALDQDAVANQLKEFEGSYSHMYVDTVGKVTVGVGTMLPTEAAAKKVAFVNRQTGAAATGDEIAADYKAVLDHAKEKKTFNLRPKVYAEVTKLDLKAGEAEAQLKEEVAKVETKLKALFPDWDQFPADARWALIDLGYNVGPNLGRKDKFPKLTEAVNKQDWAKAAGECNRPQVNQERNEWTKGKFEAAAAAEAKKKTADLAGAAPAK